MKKILSIVISGSAIILSLHSCNQPTVDRAREMARIDSMANAKLMVYRDSLRMTCMNDVMMMAQQRADSMMMANMKSPGKSSGSSKPKPTPTSTVTNPGKKGEEGVKNEGKKGADTTKPQNTGKKGVPPKQ